MQKVKGVDYDNPATYEVKTEYNDKNEIRHKIILKDGQCTSIIKLWFKQKVIVAKIDDVIYSQQTPDLTSGNPITTGSRSPTENQMAFRFRFRSGSKIDGKSEIKIVYYSKTHIIMKYTQKYYYYYDINYIEPSQVFIKNFIIICDIATCNFTIIDVVDTGTYYFNDINYIDGKLLFGRKIYDINGNLLVNKINTTKKTKLFSKQFGNYTIEKYYSTSTTTSTTTIYKTHIGEDNKLVYTLTNIDEFYIINNGKLTGYDPTKNYSDKDDIVMHIVDNKYISVLTQKVFVCKTNDTIKSIGTFRGFDKDNKCLYAKDNRKIWAVSEQIQLFYEEDYEDYFCYSVDIVPIIL